MLLVMRCLAFVAFLLLDCLYRVEALVREGKGVVVIVGKEGIISSAVGKLSPHLFIQLQLLLNRLLLGNT